MSREKILIGWTTFDSATGANKLAAELVATRLAACTQVDGPITSHYRWLGKLERAKEWRVWLKFPARNARKIEAWLKAHHSYTTPQWLAVEATVVAGPYRQWVSQSTRAPRSRGVGKG